MFNAQPTGTVISRRITLGVTGHGFYSESCHGCEHSAHNTFRDFHFVQQFPRGTHHNMKIYFWKTRKSCEQPTSGLHFQFEFHITVLRYMELVSVKQFVTNYNIKNMRFFLCTVHICNKYLKIRRVSLGSLRYHC